VGSFENLLNVSEKDIPNHELRINGQIGQKINKDMRLQIGVMYLLSNYYAPIPNHIFFLLTNARINL
jgi:hypothetical protein